MTQPTYQTGDELTRDYPDLKGGTITETVEVTSTTGQGAPGDVVSLDHPGDNLYTVDEDGDLTRCFGGKTNWEKVEEAA